MRASRATELAAEYSSVACTDWMGHTKAVAEAHYHMVRDEDFDRAVREATRGPGQNGALESVTKCVTAAGGTKTAESNKTDRK